MNGIQIRNQQKDNPCSGAVFRPIFRVKNGEGALCPFTVSGIAFGPEFGPICGTRLAAAQQRFGGRCAAEGAIHDNLWQES